MAAIICFDRVDVVSSFKVQDRRNNNRQYHHHEFLQKTLQRTLAALATKLGEPFDEIVSSFNEHMEQQQQQQKSADDASIIGEDSKVPSLSSLSTNNAINSTSKPEAAATLYYSSTQMLFRLMLLSPSKINAELA